VQDVAAVSKTIFHIKTNQGAEGDGLFKAHAPGICICRSFLFFNLTVGYLFLIFFVQAWYTVSAPSEAKYLEAM
jgi:hypothetical protein